MMRSSTQPAPHVTRRWKTHWARLMLPMCSRLCRLLCSFVHVYCTWNSLSVLLTMLPPLSLSLSLSLSRSLARLLVRAGSPSRGGDVTVYVKDINQPCLPTPFYSVLVSISVFMALSTVFHSIHSPDDSLFSHSVLPVLFLPY